MSTVIITPEIALQLQQVADEVSLTAEELQLLLRYETISILLPFLHGKSSISPYSAFDAWREINLSPSLKKGANLVTALQNVGVRVGPLGQLPVESLEKIEIKPEKYELFCLTLRELGLGDRSDYKSVERRARALEIHDGTVPPTLATELLLNKQIKFQEQHYQYRVFSQPTVHTDLLGEVVFGIKNGFPSERLDGIWFSEDEPVLIVSPHGVDDDLIYGHEKLIFARKSDGELGHEPRPARAGMWPVGFTNKRYLSKDED